MDKLGIVKEAVTPCDYCGRHAQHINHKTGKAFCNKCMELVKKALIITPKFPIKEK